MADVAAQLGEMRQTLASLERQVSANTEVAARLSSLLPALEARCQGMPLPPPPSLQGRGRPPPSPPPSPAAVAGAAAGAASAAAGSRKSIWARKSPSDEGISPSEGPSSKPSRSRTVHPTDDDKGSTAGSSTDEWPPSPLYKDQSESSRASAQKRKSLNISAGILGKMGRRPQAEPSKRPSQVQEPPADLWRMLQASHKKEATQKKEWTSMIEGIEDKRLMAALTSKEANKQILGRQDSFHWTMHHKKDVQQRCVLHPESSFRYMWDIVSIFLVFWIVLTLPPRLAFVSASNVHMVRFDFVIDLFFMVDIVLNFRTAYMVDEELVDEPRLIARNYLRSWFVLDLCSTVPFEWIVLGPCGECSMDIVGEGATAVDNGNLAQLSTMLRVFKILKLLRLLRLGRLVRFIGAFRSWLADHASWINANLVRLLSILGVMVVFCHWNACIQYMIASMLGYPEGSWVARARIDSPDLMDDWKREYTLSVFIAATQMLAMDGWNGGIYHPVLTWERWTTIISVFIGSIMYASFVASLTAVITEADPAARAYRAKLDTFNQFMRHTKLPRELRSRVRAYLELSYPRKAAFDEDSILAELTAPLRQQVRLHQCKPVLDTLQVVHVGGDPGLPGGIAQALQHMCFVEGDYVMRQGTKPDGMFFVQTGTVEIVKNKDGFETRVTTLSDGSFFGENALISDSGRATASVRAITNVNGLYLSKRNYTHLTANYPAFKKYLETVANLREKARQDEKKPRSLGKKQPVKKPETLPDTMAIRMQAAWKAQRTRKEIAEMRQGQGNPSAILLTAARTLTEKKLVKGGTSTIDDVEASSNGSPTPARSNPGSPSPGGAGSRRISWKDGGPDGGVGAGGSPFSAVGKRSGAGA